MPARECHIDLDPIGFERVAEHAFGREWRRVRTTLDQRIAEFSSGPGRFARLNRIQNYFALEVPSAMPPEIEISLEAFVNSESANFPDIRRCPRPTYVFDEFEQACDKWHDRGLKEFGPVSKNKFRDRNLKFMVICQESYRSKVTDFVERFLNGVQTQVQSGKAGPFDSGFSGKYRLNEITVQYFTTPDGTASSYSLAVDEATRNGNGWDFAIVQVLDADKSLRSDQSPYLVTKARLLSLKIASQEFTLETAELPISRLAYALNNMALATYAKLGGTPWLLRSPDSGGQDLVVGLGSANVGHGKLAARDRLVGITTVFSGDGSYRLSNLSKSVAFEHYRPTLVDTVVAAVNKASMDLHWDPHLPIRLTFHYSFKSFSREDVHAVKDAVNTIVDCKIDFAFVNFLRSSPHLIFDLRQQGAFDAMSRQFKGAYAPDRSSYLQLSKSQILLNLVGPKEVKRPADGMPHPVLIDLHPLSTFRDMGAIVNQIFAFSCHSWQSLNPSSLPVTIQYSNLIAKQLGQLSRLSSWDAHSMATGIHGSRWFL
ncbi:hypothetical protein [Fuerstiella marisgermanici]|uniref:hypothetical protein n=1 Tax=Fuerstiella marisgermanici TaxID=1891926 RepID=UPI0011AB3105|nr:hypothetical protein [Fuerstiella marisgermanici]